MGTSVLDKWWMTAGRAPWRLLFGLAVLFLPVSTTARSPSLWGSSPSSTGPRWPPSLVACALGTSGGWRCLGAASSFAAAAVSCVDDRRDLQPAGAACRVGRRRRGARGGGGVRLRRRPPASCPARRGGWRWCSASRSRRSPRPRSCV